MAGKGSVSRRVRSWLLALHRLRARHDEQELVQGLKSRVEIGRPSAVAVELGADELGHERGRHVGRHRDGTDGAEVHHGERLGVLSRQENEVGTHEPFDLGDPPGIAARFLDADDVRHHEARTRIASEAGTQPELQVLADFLAVAGRGVIR